MAHALVELPALYETLDARLKALEERAPGVDFQDIKDDIAALKEALYGASKPATAVADERLQGRTKRPA